MRRAVLYGFGWLATAAVAVLLAWQGVGLVGRNVTDTHPRGPHRRRGPGRPRAGSGPAGEPVRHRPADDVSIGWRSPSGERHDQHHGVAAAVDGDDDAGRRR